MHHAMIGQSQLPKKRNETKIPVVLKLVNQVKQDSHNTKNKRTKNSPSQHLNDESQYPYPRSVPEPRVSPLPQLPLPPATPIGRFPHFSSPKNYFAPRAGTLPARAPTARAGPGGAGARAVGPGSGNAGHAHGMM